MSTREKLVAGTHPAPAARGREALMQVVYPRCCGLDVHKRSVVACVLLTREDGTVERAVRTFGTMTAELLALDDWLARLGGAPVALESTGIYWRPAFNLLADDTRP